MEKMTAKIPAKEIRMKESKRMLMELNSGFVQSEAEWREEFEEMAPERWGGPDFEDAALVEVVFDKETGTWTEKEK